MEKKVTAKVCPKCGAFEKSATFNKSGKTFTCKKCSHEYPRN